MSVDESGAVWLAGIDDVAVYRRGSISRVKLGAPVSCAVSRVHAIAERNGSVWAAAVLDVPGPAGLVPSPGQSVAWQRSGPIPST